MVWGELKLNRERALECAGYRGHIEDLETAEAGRGQVARGAVEKAVDRGLRSEAATQQVGQRGTDPPGSELRD